MCKEKRCHGLAASLLRELEEYGERHNCLSISAKVAADLKANQFWEREGYKIAQQVDGGKTTGRRINVRVKDLDVPGLFDALGLSSETQHTELTVNARPTVTNITYAIDLNVIMDLVRERSNEEYVRKLFGFSMYGGGQLCVTPEFKAELKKRTLNSSNDPLLSMAKSLPTLPPVSEDILSPICGQLQTMVFPEREDNGSLTENDYADINHLAHCIHHEITGFITSERALLRASEDIYYKFGIEILSPSDAVTTMCCDKEDASLCITISHEGGELTISQFDEGNRTRVESFLIGKGIEKSERRDMLDSGVIERQRIRWVVEYGDSVVGYSSWGGDEFSGYRVFYLVVDESFSLAQKVIDHFIEKLSSSLPLSKSSLIALYVPKGNDLTRKSAIERGFRKNTSTSAGIKQFDLVKISYKGCIANTDWSDFKSSIAKVIDLSLPERMPTYSEFVYTGVVMTSRSVSGAVKVPLFDMETLFSPATFLCLDRQAIIIPIKKQYIDLLLSEARSQLSLNLFPDNEALLHTEKVYFRSPRNTKMFKKGELLLFYVSGKDGGKEIVGHGRLTSSLLLDFVTASLKLKRQGALGEKELYDIAGDKGLIHAITFDNFTFFKNPVEYHYLKQHSIISGANLVTAERISSKHLHDLFIKGGCRE